MSYLSRELFLRDQSIHQLKKQHLNLKDLKKFNIIIQSIYKELDGLSEFTFISDSGDIRWCDFIDQVFDKVVADLRPYVRLEPQQYLNLLKLTQSDHLVIIVNDLVQDEILKFFYNLSSDINVINLPELANYKDEVFENVPYEDKISKVLRIINTTVEQEVIIYCENLHQIDQIYQALYFHQKFSQSYDFEIHISLPAETFYQDKLQKIMDLAFPKLEGKRKIFLTQNYSELRIANKQLNAQLIIQMGYMREIRKYDQLIEVIVYKQIQMSKTEILLRNRVGYFPKIIYLFTFEEFQNLPENLLFNSEELDFNQEVMYTRAQVAQLNIQLTQQNLVEEEFYRNNIPYPYHVILADMEHEQTLNYLSQIISTICTPGDILSEGNLDSKKNPFRSYQYHQNRELIIRANHYWSKQGDCASWVQLINKFIIYMENIVHSENEDSDNVNKDKQQLDLIEFCRLQNINLPKLLLIIAYQEYILKVINKTHVEFSLLNKLADQEKLEDLPLGLTRTVSLKKQSSLPEHSEEIQHYLLRKFYKGLCVFAGHKTAGYFNYISKQTFRLCYNNLMSIMGDYHLTCIILALRQNLSNNLEVKYSNKIDDVIIPQIAPQQFVKQHKLNFIKRHSLHYKEISLKGIGQALFNELWKNQQGPKLQQECILEPNLDMNLINIQFDPNVSNEQAIRDEMNALIEKIKTQLKLQVRELPYHNDTKFIMESGGRMRDWIDKSAYKTFFVQGLPPAITPEDLDQFFIDEGVIITDKKMNKIQDGSITARITVQDHDDVQWCVENIKQYKEFQLKVVTQSDQYEHDEQKLIFKETYKVEINWNLNINKGWAIVEAEQLEQNENLKNLNIQIENLEPKLFKLTNLDQYLTLIELKELLKDNNAKIIEFPLRFRYETKGDLAQSLQSMLYQFKDKFKLDQVQKLLSQRTAILDVNKIDDVELFTQLNNQVKCLLGQHVKLYVKGVYQHDYEGPIEMKQILQDLVEKLNQSMDIDVDNQLVKVRLRAYSKESFINQKKEIDLLFQGIKVENLDLSCFFSQYGVKQLKLWENQYQVLIKLDYVNNSIIIHASQLKYGKIVDEMTKVFNIFYLFSKQVINENCKLLIQIPKESSRAVMGNDSQGLLDLKKNFGLVNVKYNSISRELTIHGKQESLDKAMAAIQDLIENQQEKKIAAIICGLCLDEMRNGYMLQGCGHKFCLEDIKLAIQDSLKDANTLPIKCPQCSLPILMADLYVLLDEITWEKLIKLSVNKYVSENLAELNFCITPNCPIIFYNKFPRYTCPKCQKIYCNTCRVEYHFGQTCREFKAGQEDAIAIYMKKNDVRKCTSCKSLIQRIDGCYRVTCSSCQKSLCWKMDKEGKPCMLAFPNASECYAHLTKEHGGYW